MLWPVYILLALLSLAVLLLGRYTIELTWRSDGKDYQFSVGTFPWSGLFHIVWTQVRGESQLSFRILRFGFQPSTQKKKKEEGKVRSDKKKKRKKLSLPFLHRIITIIPRHIRRLIRIFNIQEGLCYLRLGVGDPARTGQIYGVVHAMQFLLPQRIVLCIEPDFSQTVVVGEALLKIRFTVLRIIGIALSAIIQMGWKRIRHKK